MKKKAFKMPHQLIIMLMIAALATLATYIIPAGAYDMIEINGRKAIDASSFHYIDQTPVNPWQAILALPGGFSKQVAIIAMITIIAGAMGIINKTKCIDASIGKLVSTYKDRLVLLIPILLGIFSVLGAMGSRFFPAGLCASPQPWCCGLQAPSSWCAMCISFANSLRFLHRMRRNLKRLSPRN